MTPTEIVTKYLSEFGILIVSSEETEGGGVKGRHRIASMEPYSYTPFDFSPLEVQKAAKLITPIN